MGHVYRLHCSASDLDYVGRTSKTAFQRFEEHCKNSRNGCQKLISKAIREYGRNSFEIEILWEAVDDMILNQKEKEFISLFQTNVSQGGRGYNSTAGGQGTSGFKWTQKSRSLKEIQFIGSIDDLKKDAETLSYLDMSKKYCVSTTVLGRWLSEFGISKTSILSKPKHANNQHKNAWSQSELNLLETMLNDHKSYDEISTKINRSKTAIAVKARRVRK